MFREEIIRKSSYYISILLIILGLYDLWKRFGNIALLLLIILPLLLELAARYFYKPWFARFFKILPPACYYITESKHEINVNPNGHAVIATYREMIFFKKIRKWELYDIFYVSKKILREDFIYLSSDAEEIGRKWLGESKLVIFWQPKNQFSISPLIPYKHDFSWEAHTNYNEQYNNWEVIPIVKTGKHLTVIKTQKNVEYAATFKKPWYMNIEDDRKISIYGYKLKTAQCPQPEIKRKNEIIWTQYYMKPNDVYICVFFYEGGCETIRKLIG